MNDDIAKTLFEKYTTSELLQAYLLHEAKFRLSDIHNLDEKTVEENYENIENMMFDDVEIFNYDHIDRNIEKYFNPDEDKI